MLADPTAGLPGGADAPTTALVGSARGTGRVLALTVDDGPAPGPTEALLDLLADLRIRATFCVVGEQVQAPGGADVLRRTVAEGHVLANHGTTYADMGAWPADRVRADLRENLRVIRAALGDPAAPVPFFRAPNGSWGATAAVAVELGMQPLGLGAVIGDWLTQDAAVLAGRLREQVRPGGILLVHDGGGDRWGTVAALRAVLPELVAEGWAFDLPARRG